MVAVIINLKDSVVTSIGFYEAGGVAAPPPLEFFKMAIFGQKIRNILAKPLDFQANTG